ncbi:hypothetical protein SLEP1_g57781 [Rubroshorea leprosula]|uniref:Uncharacterized protein n=1 Tax=Rubroshorea leprosula TaxID=152421 RepID=A0AAV5MMG0_9ROSI|nr:hypothetical protein SLEP1_g57781 [Rubroshorea leprosula]
MVTMTMIENLELVGPRSGRRSKGNMMGLGRISLKQSRCSTGRSQLLQTMAIEVPIPVAFVSEANPVHWNRAIQAIPTTPTCSAMTCSKL